MNRDLVHTFALMLDRKYGDQGGCFCLFDGLDESGIAFKGARQRGDNPLHICSEEWGHFVTSNHNGSRVVCWSQNPLEPILAQWQPGTPTLIPAPPPVKSNSYQDRAGTDCLMLGDIEGQTCWGLVRFSSHGCYLCEGHRSPPDYRPEPVPLTEDEKAALAASEATRKRSLEEQREARRWFRPIEAELKAGAEIPIGLFWSSVSDVMLSCLHSAIGEPIMIRSYIHDAILGELDRLGRIVTAEVYRRGLPWPDSFYQLQLAPPWVGVIYSRDPAYTDPIPVEDLALPFQHLPTSELHLLYGVAAHCVDYSCLERGTRQAIMHLWHHTEAELKRRETTPTFLIDLQPDT